VQLFANGIHQPIESTDTQFRKRTGPQFYHCYHTHSAQVRLSHAVAPRIHKTADHPARESLEAPYQGQCGSREKQSSTIKHVTKWSQAAPQSAFCIGYTRHPDAVSVGKPPDPVWVALLPIGSRHIHSVLLSALLSTLSTFFGTSKTAYHIALTRWLAIPVTHD
jgi:hypothetical protein